MRLSSKSRYAVMAMVDLALAEHAAHNSLTAIAERQGLPLPYLEQLFNKLRKAGLVRSTRGASGGYQLAYPAEQLRVFDIIDAVDRPLKATRCENATRGCLPEGNRCSTHSLWDQLGQIVQMFLKGVTLADIKTQHIQGKSHAHIP